MAATSLSVLDSTGTAKTFGTFTDAAGTQHMQVSGDTAMAHYGAAKNQLTPVASPTAVFVLAGNATTTVRVKRIVLSGIATSAGETPFSVKIGSDAGTLGSAVLTSISAVPFDSGAAAASSTLKTVGTANYGTLPALVGTIWTAELPLLAGTTGAGAPVIIDFGVGGRQAVVLRGTSQVLYIDFLATAVPSGGKYSCTMEWSEDAS